MEGDFSRDSFDPRKRFSRVMMQQGRVQLDSDWNEQTSLTLGYIRTLAADLLGLGAGPVAACGFQIVDSQDGQADTSAGKPDATSTARKKPAGQALKNGELMILPGRYYVGGILVELDAPMLYSAQPGCPFNDSTSTEALKGATSWIAYLDVWEEFVSADQEDDIREPALGGVDSCGRALIRWQVRILVDPAKEILDDFTQFRPGDHGTLTAWTKAGETPDKPCIIPPDAKYRGLENQLYRVEIHRGSDESGGGATFKWSRDNGSLVYPVKDVNDELVRLDHLGRDERSELAVGQWVELVDDMWTGHDPRGPLGQVSEVRRDERSVIVQWVKPVTTLPRSTALAGGLRPVLRRWDHKAQAEADGGAIPTDSSGAIELEDGIFIQFQPKGLYRAGDYWLIPARVATSGILWPVAAGAPEPRPPHGPAHFYAPLADFQNGNLTDRRRKFAPVLLKA
jgi:hypothetical protein